MDAERDAVEAYELAQSRAVQARKAWADAGSPLTLVQTNHVEGVHPLWKVLLESEGFAARLRRDLKPRQEGRGRPKAASSAPDRRAEPPRLRAVR